MHNLRHGLYAAFSIGLTILIETQATARMLDEKIEQADLVGSDLGNSL